MQQFSDGTLFLWPDHWQVVGHLLPNRPHRHTSASWLVGLDGPFRLQIEGRWRHTRAALVAPDVEQALDPDNTRMWCAQLDPDSAFWRGLQPRLNGADSTDFDVDTLKLPSGTETGCEAVEAALSAAVGQVGVASEPIDPRIARVCDWLRSELPERIEVAELAEAVGLSSSRLSHLFRQETGVTLRRFLLHLKMNQVLAQWEQGKSLSQLALEAGFYDQPHFVRTARGMFDALPSEYASGGRFRICRCGLSS